MIVKTYIPAYGGISIGRNDGKVIMVDGALPGETLEVKIDKEKKDYAFASILKILKPSPYRTEPPCRYVGKCGGCQMQHASYEGQVKIKEDVLRDSLKRIAKTETPLGLSLIGDDPLNYRYNGQFKVSRYGTGFYGKKSNKVINIDICLLMRKEINEALIEAKKLLKGVYASELHITFGNSLLAMIKLRKQSLGKITPDELASRFLKSGFAGVYISEKGKTAVQYGEPTTSLDLQGVNYPVSPMNFFQSNWRLNSVFVKLIKDELSPFEGKKVLDLYAGSGNFSLCLSPDAEVTAVEENYNAIEDGKRNIKLNSIKNYNFIHSTAEAFSRSDYFDIIILDPPRSGLADSVVENVLKILPERIVYISCNPAAFARDLNVLLGKYSIDSLRMIDFFPQTFHIEAVAFMRKK